MKRVVSWVIIGAAWAVLLPVGVCCALLLPLNLVLVPCWFAAASSLGVLARELLDKPAAAAPDHRT